MEIYFLALNLLTLLCFGLLFSILSRKEPRLKHVRHFSYALYFCSIAFAIDLFAPLAIRHFEASLVTYMIFSFGIFAVVKGIFLRYGRPFPAKTVAGLLLVAEVVMIAVMLGHSVAMGRVVVSFLAAPIFGISILAAMTRRTQTLDRLVLASLVMGTVIMAAHPIVTGVTILFPSVIGGYSETVHAFVIYFSVTLLAIPLGAILLFASAMELFVKLHDKSTIDGLTGIMNRGAFEENATLIVQEGGIASLIVCDIDHFKRINDTQGHTAGDVVIRTVAGLMQSQCSGAQFAGRVGGEEFCIMLPLANAEMASLFAESLRMQIALTGLKNGDRAVTVSMGIAALTINEDYKSLFERADAALYQAKNTGRDRVCMASHFRPVPSGAQAVSAIRAA
jgi:diguanylate cyclase (GGDEF)-like protein